MTEETIKLLKEILIDFIESEGSYLEYEVTNSDSHRKALKELEELK